MTAQELYDATRGVWRLGPERHAADYALSVAGGVVQEVYFIEAWHPAGTTPYATRTVAEVTIPGRWEFTGRTAPAEVRAKYLGQSVAHYFQKGSVSPVNYVNVKRA